MSACRTALLRAGRKMPPKRLAAKRAADKRRPC